MLRSAWFSKRVIGPSVALQQVKTFTRSDPHRKWAQQAFPYCVSKEDVLPTYAMGPLSQRVVHCCHLILIRRPPARTWSGVVSSLRSTGEETSEEMKPHEKVVLTTLMSFVINIDNIRRAALMGSLVAGAPGNNKISDVATLAVDDLWVVTHICLLRCVTTEQPLRNDNPRCAVLKSELIKAAS